MAGDSGWKTTTVGELIEEFGGEIKTGPFGTKLKAAEYSSTGVPVISVGEVGMGRLMMHARTPKVDVDVTDRMPEYILRAGDIVFGRKGAVERSALVTHGEDGWFLGSDGIRLRLPSECDPRFMSYQFLSASHLQWMVQHATGTTMASLNQRIIERIPLILPSIPEQKAIARILGALDDKIELNRRMNETLEAMARAIFKSWFVDLDPVRAKLDGRQPPGMDAETAALFPDRFEHSELGLVPKGWDVCSIKDRASTVQYGFTASATEEPIGPRFLRITDIRGGRIEWDKVPFCAADAADLERYRVTDGDIVVARTGASTGDNLYIVDPPVSVFASYLVRFQFNEPAVARFVGEYMQTNEYAAYVAGSIGGSAQPNANAQTLAGARVTFPPYDLCAKFLAGADPMDRARSRNERETRTLAATRDALLPKLLSGEIRVADAERIAESAQNDPNDARERLNHHERNGRSTTSEAGSHRSNGVDANGEPGTTPKPSAVDDVDQDEAMAAFRQALRGRAELSREELIGDVAQRLGFRNGEIGRETLENHLRAAIRRKIVGADGPDVVFAETPTMAEYTTDELIGFVRSVTRKGIAYEREELTRALATHLGFARVTDKTGAAVEFAIAEAIRRGVLVREGTTVRRER